MEPDRFAQNHVFYVVGLFCLVAGLGLLAFGLYIFPNLILGWRYSIPDFIMDFSGFFQDQYGMSAQRSSWIVSALLLLPALIFILIADVLSNKIDQKIYGISSSAKGRKLQQANRIQVGESGTKGLFFTIVMIIVVVFIAAELIQWVISSTQNTNKS
jgi:hypothetical protein